MNTGPGKRTEFQALFRDRFLLLAVLAAAYLAGLYLRLLELPFWDHPLLALDGEPLMATHDAYAWLAGAKGLGTGADSAMSGLLSFAADACGTTLGKAAFWIPALAGPLVGVAAALWGWTLGGPAAALTAGMLASVAPGFLNRTRLGYFDTDIVTLLFPLVQCWLLAHWLDPWLRRPWSRPQPDQTEEQPGAVFPLLAGLAMLLGNGQWHPQLANFSAGALALGALLAALAARPGARYRLFAGLASCGLAAFGGVPGLLAALVLTAAHYAGLDQRIPAAMRIWAGAAALACTLALVPQLPSMAGNLAELAAVYSRPRVEQRETGTAPASGTAIYPGVTQSVIEARSEGLGRAMDKLSGWRFASLTGLIGFAAVVVLRPAALFLAPFAVLSLLGGVMGARMSMFGGPVVALGLALPLSWGLSRLLRERPWRGAAILAAQALLAGLMLLPLHTDYSRLRPTPALAVQQAQALKALGALAAPDAALWTWWDWGYAAQYYAGIRSFADGARHGGEYLYPLALTLTTPVPLQARQMMQYAAVRDYRPWETFDLRPAGQVREFIASLAASRYDLRAAPPQYLLATWETMRLAHWITYYGTWDVSVGEGMHGMHKLLADDFIDEEQGTVTPENSPAITLRSADELTSTGRALRSYPHKEGARLVVNRPAGQAVLLDDVTYNGMMVRLLLCPPDDAEITRQFRLVYDGYPLVRIWEARKEERMETTGPGGPED